MSGIALALVLWVAGLGIYFWRTTEEQREGHLVIVWGILLLPSLYFGVKLLARLFD